jgi:orotidine-5'-phosphate decarboxylase
VTGFAARLVAAARTLGPLCVGIDPHAGRVPALFGGDTPDGLARWGEAIIGQVVGRAGIIKPQVGLFERLGPDGMRALQRVCEAARDAGLIVIADAKRGDIGSTAEGYAQAYLGKSAPFPCDAVTVNPYMGIDTLEPFLSAAESHGKGVVVLTRTSNPGSADFQMQDMGGAPLYARVVEALQPAIRRWSPVQPGLMRRANCGNWRRNACSWFPATARKAAAPKMPWPVLSGAEITLKAAW